MVGMLFGCWVTDKEVIELIEKHVEDDTKLDTDWDTDDNQTRDIPVSFSWDDRCTAVLTIEGDPADYYLGIAETGVGGDGWYGEDCGNGNLCHPAGATGVTLTSIHPECGGGGIDDIVAGSTTLFYEDLEANLTYVVDSSNGECWTWGDDVSYYAAARCTAI